MHCARAIVLALFFVFPFLTAYSKTYTPTSDLTDAVFPRTNPKRIAVLYQMLKVIDELFTEHEITYWIHGGTALGAVRHQGIIPWDDDADLIFLAEDTKKILSLKKHFAEYGFFLRRDEVIRLFPSETVQYPFIDLSAHSLHEDNKIRHHLPALNQKFKKFYFLPEEITPLVRVPFGPIFLNAPNNMMRYLYEGYGKDCMEKAVFQKPHRGNSGDGITTEKVKIVDFSPARYQVENFQVPLD